MLDQLEMQLNIKEDREWRSELSMEINYINRAIASTSNRITALLLAYSIDLLLDFETQ